MEIGFAMLDILRSFFFNKKLTEKTKKNETYKLPETQLMSVFAGADSDFKLKALKEKLLKLGSKSIAIRQIDAGSTNDNEHEIAALENPIYDVNRFGIKVVASPRHADMLLVTGPVTPGMKMSLINAYEATPDPKIVVAVGDGAISGRISPSIAGHSLSKVSDCIPVDIEIPGDPPEPGYILGVLLGVLENV